MARRANEADTVRWRVRGVRHSMFHDIYPRLMAAPWTVTIAWAFAAYLGGCLVFAALYALEPAGVEGAESYSDLLWFSVQTLSTIGYGGMTPLTPWANLLVVLESFIGLAGVAVVTAILYAKFSLPAARVQFTDSLAVHDRNGVPTLHLRMLNERPTPILDVHLHAGVLIVDDDGAHRFRRLVDLKLARDRVPVFSMAFTVMHTIDDDSPLRDLQDDPDQMVFLIVTMRGVDDRTLQPVFARAMYRPHHLVFGEGFGDMVTQADDGTWEVDATRLHARTPRELTTKRR